MIYLFLFELQLFKKHEHYIYYNYIYKYICMYENDRVLVTFVDYTHAYIHVRICIKILYILIIHL